MRQVLVAERYRLSEPLGVGGMGRVWRARDEVLRRDVAIKEIVLPAGLTREERAELRLRTMREARTAARLNHPNVVQIYDVVDSGDQPWIVMEYVPSRSLYDVIRQVGPVSAEHAAHIGLSVLSALRAAHAAGVLHRDVKPGNVLLAADGRVVLTDFGLAVFDTGEGEGAVTRPGLVLGSPQYVAPERARDGISSPEADLWSLGATLYAAVEGRAPYARASAMATLTALATAQPAPPTRAGPLRPVLDGLLRKNPRTRITAAEAERLLRRAASGDNRPGTARRPALPRLGRLAWGVAGIVTVLLAVPLGIVLTDTTERPDRGAGAAQLDNGATPALGPVLCSGSTESVPVSTRSRSLAPYPTWVWYDDPSGFTISVPGDWTMSRSGSTVCFRQPGGDGLLAVDQWQHTDPTLVAFWERRSAELVRDGRLPGYAKLALERRELFAGAADWEYLYDGPGGTRLHAIARGLVTAPARAFAIHWQAREFDWPAALVYLQYLTISFTPPAT